MALNIISNFAANIAHRNLAATDLAATRSLAKLSSGTRVVAARDDAASLAIGSRLAAEVAALRQAGVNAGQASSMLQIADGALATISDMLTRMKALAVQASSGQLSSTERTFLDNEFGELRNEINRIAKDTEFNGTVLLNGSNTFSAGTIGVDIDQNSGLEQFIFSGNPGTTFVSSGDTLAITYSTSTDQFTMTNQATGVSQVSEAVPTAPGAGSFKDVTLSDFGLTIRLNSQFDVTTAIADSTAGNIFIVGGGSSNQLQFSFKVGTGTTSDDKITFDLKQATDAQLATGLDTDAISTASGADTAITNLSTAIDKLNEIRADVGAAQNRIEFAAANLAASTENAEAARSNLLDLDIAQEISVFTSKQVLLQAGVSMLAQANQLPQNLLALLR